MKIVYCIHSLAKSGGMERVLTNKVNYLAGKGYDMTVITTEDKGSAPFFPIAPDVGIIELDINYNENDSDNVFIRLYTFVKKQIIHKRRLRKSLSELKADIVISMFGKELPILPSAGDGSKKIAEIHFSRFFRQQFGHKGIFKLFSDFHTFLDLRLVRRYDRFVVLTQEDKGYWGDCPGIEVIPNASVPFSGRQAKLEAKKAVAVGRLSYQKGYDLLISVWKQVHPSFPDWKLEIYGAGEQKDMLSELIRSEGLEDSVRICAPVKDVESVYLDASVLVLSSRYEGLPMVLLEAMSCGVPCAAFACKCGPKDIIEDRVSGLLAEDGNVGELAERLAGLMSDEMFRKRLGEGARLRSLDFSEESVMSCWEKLFNEMAGGKR